MNWIVENINNAFATWNEKVAEIWALIATSPQDFKGGGIWSVMVDINGGMKAVAYSLLILFTAMSIFSGTMNFKELRRPETALRYFIRFVATKTAITYCMDIMTLVFEICGNVAARVAENLGAAAGLQATLSDEMTQTIDSVGFFDSIPLWIVSLIGTLLITVLSFMMIMTVYGRFFKVYMYTAIAPISLAFFGGEVTASHGKQFIRNYVGVCMEGAVVVLALLIFSGFTSEPTATTATSAVMQVWGYLAETVFNLLVVVGLVKASDRTAKELFGI